MESTLLESFLRVGKLKRWLAKLDCLAVIKECKQPFDKVYMLRVPDSVHSNNLPLPALFLMTYVGYSSMLRRLLYLLEYNTKALYICCPKPT
jgi:hypothetical protein